MGDVWRFPKSGPETIGEISERVIARIAKRAGFVRLEVYLRTETADQLNEAVARAGKSLEPFVADMVRAAFPGGSNPTVLISLELCAADQLLLEMMAAAAGKTVDVVVSDIVFQALTEERELRERMGRADDEDVRRGA